MQTTVALVEDDPELREALRRGLSREGFKVTSAASGGELLERVSAATPDVLVIDIGLPDSDGRDVCQALRARGVESPVIFLTAHGTLADRLSGFHAGGDDYLVKPFAFKELVVRLRALAKRTVSSGLEVAGLQLDPTKHAVSVAGGPEVSLTPTEFRLLGALAAGVGGVIRRHELVASAWPDGAIVHDNTLDAYMARLRRKLRELGRSDAIATVHGVGYRLG